jgi:hypothetical protein
MTEDGADVLSDVLVDLVGAHVEYMENSALTFSNGTTLFFSVRNDSCEVVKVHRASRRQWVVVAETDVPAWHKPTPRRKKKRSP